MVTPKPEKDRKSKRLSAGNISLILNRVRKRRLNENSLFRSCFLFMWSNLTYIKTALINTRTAIAGAIIGLFYFFYNSKNLNCIGALSFFLRSVHTFS